MSFLAVSRPYSQVPPVSRSIELGGPAVRVSRSVKPGGPAVRPDAPKSSRGVGILPNGGLVGCPRFLGVARRRR